jgi:C1A family cysteine protease
MSVAAPAFTVPHKSALPRLLSIFDQGQIGSCTANMGVVQALWLAKRAGNDSIVFSRLFLYDVTRIQEGTPLAEDSGAQIRDVMKALAKYGVCEESLWPYDDVEKRFSVSPSPEASADALKHRALFYYRCASLHALKASIVQGFPVGFGFTVYTSMMSDEVAQTGEVPYPLSSDTVEGGHAVVAMGYDDTKQIKGETGAVLCQNSWGQAWGDAGFFWLPYRYFTEALADDMWTLRREML